MNDRPDRSGIDLERELVRYMAEHRITRRMLLEQVAKVGAFAAFAPIIAACARPARRQRPVRRGSTVPAERRPGAPTRGRSPRRRRSRRRSRSRDRAPHLELRRVHGRGRHPVSSRTSTRSRSAPTSSMPRRDVRESHRRPDGGFDITFPASTDDPGPRPDRQASCRSTVAHPEQGQPRHRMAEPGLRPGQQHSDAVHVVDDRRRLRHGQDQGGADQLEGALGRALEGPHRDARRPARGLRGGAHPARLPRQHDRRRRARPGARPAQAAAAARPAVQRRGPAVHGLAATSGSGMPDWGSDIYTVQQKKPSVEFYIPRRARSAGRTRRSSSTAPRTRSPPTCSSTTCSMPRSAPRTRTTSATWARTRRPSSTSPRTSSTRPWINPDKAVVDKLQELLDLGPRPRQVRVALDRAEGGHLGAPAPARAVGGLLVLPGAVWLALFFLVPLVFIARGQRRDPRPVRAGPVRHARARQLPEGVRADVPADHLAIGLLRGDDDDPVDRDRLPDRLLDQPLRRTPQGAPADPRDAPVLDELPHPDLRLDDHPARQRRRELDPAGARPHERADHPPQHRLWP